MFSGFDFEVLAGTYTVWVGGQQPVLGADYDILSGKFTRTLGFPLRDCDMK